MRRIVIFVLLLCSVSLFAQEISTTPHKHRFIEFVNQGDYSQALTEFYLVEDWQFDVVDRKNWLDVDKVLEFVYNLDTLKVNKNEFENLFLYVITESDLIVERLVTNEEYSYANNYLKKRIELIKFFYGESHSLYIESIRGLYDIYYNLGQYHEENGNAKGAIYYYNEALKICDKESHDYANILNNLGLLFAELEEISLAEKCYTKAAITYYKLYGNDTNYALTLNNLGNLYIKLEKFSEAELFHIRSLEISSKSIETTESFFSQSVHNVWYLYIKWGEFYFNSNNYIEAEKCYLKSIKIREKLNDNYYSGDICLSFLSLGRLYNQIGKYSDSEKYLLSSLNISSLLFGNNSLEYALSLNALGDLYCNLSNYSKAERYFLDAMNIRKDFIEESYYDYIQSLNNLGVLYKYKGEINKSIEYLTKALEIRSNYTETWPSEYANSISNLGSLYLEIGNYSEAERCYLEALRIRKEANEELNCDIADTYYNLGGVYFAQGYFSESEKYFLESLNIYREIFSQIHPKYEQVLNVLGGVYFYQGKYSEAENYFLESSNIRKVNFYSSLDFMIELERYMYSKNIKSTFERVYPLFLYRYYKKNPSISTFAYDNELFTKGLLLTSTNEVHNSILKSGDSILINQWNELTEAKQVVMHLEEKEPTSSQLEIYRHRADSLEKRMTISSAAFRESKKQWNINWESVKKQLSKNEVAIEYFSAPLSQDSTMYCALVLRHNSKYPELIPLFEEKEVSSHLNKINDKYDNNNLYSVGKEGIELTLLVWSKLLPKLKEGETIYFSPSGLLHQLGIEYLPLDSARTMSDVYNMVRLSSTREIVTNKSKESYKSAVVYGGIHYDLDNNVILEESNRYPGVKHRTLENDSINRGSAKFLPGTKEEAEKINKLLSDNKIEVKIFKTKTANEESFKSLSGKHNNILHIATHGFTWTDSTARKQDYFADRMKMQLIGDNQMRGPVIDPLDRCGLLFAGANIALQGKSKELPEGVQDGILTAKEISLMDLRDAELVVLSACETAKGDITSEGVFGLQRAFKMAGAKTIIMSLWKVDDRATQMLMTEFYSNWIGKGLSKREAFRNAQNVVKKQYPEPSYWAGFIMLD